MIVYVDTSAFVKLFLREPESPRAAKIWELADSVTSARLVYPEVRATLAAARRARRLSGRRYATALRDFEDRFGELWIQDLTDEVARTAGAAAERYRLPASDAIHLASALAVPAEVTVSTWDADLRRAALDEGLAVAP